MQWPCAILLSVTCLALQCFSTFSHKRHDFRLKKVIERKICVLVYRTIFPETFFIIKIIERDMIKNVYRSSCKLLVNFVRFLWNLNFLDTFSKKKYSNLKFHENPSIRNRVFLCRQKDMTKLRAAFRSFANESKKVHVSVSFCGFP